ncbi:hypothetical protein COCC4DRAFT_126257 [Bipolaris maydis ATCC 48331]|uniref:Uncharacterized protein n=2 Tax=Cochliobolus heterostrophus TaxID=5016 RepID=M2TUD2_COCH5|nr:uncharacterized protein COCC4DRAFT_126257 [Bipolaris maydis ATCC 48331]EMD90144.1 hypothetical protein COCHEDRAFT_1157169 [Bipolaris maydis C5]ENI09641.1 hypothetical protein COCC4DRAFT_126257 [Bipolaris maydis ATCC 48331]
MPFPAAFGLPALPAHPPPVPCLLSSALPAPFIIKPSPCSCSCSSPHPILLSPASPSSPAAATGRHSRFGPHLISPSSPACPPTSLSACARLGSSFFSWPHYLAVPDARCTCCCTSLWPTSGTRRLACCLCATVCRQCAAPPVPLHNICLPAAAVCFVT